MDQLSLESMLSDLTLPSIRYFPTIDSTNDEAWRWFSAGAPDRALVIADEQTAGRGRSGRRWVTPKGASLAFSLVLFSPPFDQSQLSRLSGLGAVAARSALRKLYQLPVQVKWPNDVLVNLKKVAGVLVETRWEGERLRAVVVGIGINIAPESISAVNLPPAGLNFPATCIENEIHQLVNRVELLHAILEEFYVIRLPRLASDDFIHEWEDCLAFQGQWVGLTNDSPSPGNQNMIVGKLIGLNQNGALRLTSRTGEQFLAEVGEVHLRPIPDVKHALPPD